MKGTRKKIHKKDNSFYLYFIVSKRYNMVWQDRYERWINHYKGGKKKGLMVITKGTLIYEESEADDLLEKVRGRCKDGYLTVHKKMLDEYFGGEEGPNYLGAGRGTQHKIKAEPEDFIIVKKKVSLNVIINSDEYSLL
jgi:hypothetical protein